MTAYRVGDIPAEVDVFDVPADVVVAGNYTAVSGVLYGPTGAVVVLTGAAFTLGTDSDEQPAPGPSVTVSWGTTTPFATPGEYSLALQLTGSGTVQQSLPWIPVIAQSEDGWHTIESLRGEWPDAPWQDELVFELLDIAKQQVLAYAPVLVPNEDLSVTIPSNYRKGQALQARNTWNATKVDAASGGLGADTFQIQPRPLDWFVKQVLRPASPLGFVA